LEKIKSPITSDVERFRYFDLVCSFAAAAKTAPFTTSVKDALTTLLERHKQLVENENKPRNAQTADNVTGLNSTPFSFVPKESELFFSLSSHTISFFVLVLERMNFIYSLQSE
jgi:hypothetical protein